MILTPGLTSSPPTTTSTGSVGGGTTATGRTIMGYTPPPVPSNSLGIPTNDASYASDTNAAIASATWARYKQTFQPLEDVLTNMVNNPQYDQQQVTQAGNNFNSQFDSGVQGTQQMLGRQGVSMTPDQQNEYTRFNQIQKSLGQVNAGNNAIRGIRENEFNILGAGTQPYIQTQQQLGLGLLK